MILALAFAAAAILDVPVTEEGASFCVDLAPDPPGEYYVRMTATDAGGDMSGLSNEIRKPLPGQVCWENPDANVNESTLTDLVSVRVLYDQDPIGTVHIVPKAPAVDISVDLPCNGCQSTTVVPGQTGQTVPIEWNTSDGPFELEIYRWPDEPDDAPILRAPSLTSNFFNWTPTRAGVYVVRIDGQTLNAGAAQHLLYIKLAAPDPGGID